MSTAALQIIADARKYQAEIAKIPGYTDKAAAKAGVALATKMEAAQRKAAQEAERAAKRAGDAWDVAIKVKIVDSLANVGIMAAQTFAQWAIAGVTAADSMGDLSQESGVAVETLLAIRDAAMRAGEDFGPLQQSFSGMAKKIYDFASTGGGKAADVFRDLGVQVHAADGSLRSVDAIAVQTIASLQGMADKTQQAALATKLLGDSGQEMLRVLGDRKIDEWAASMTGAADDVARTNEALDAMNLSMAGLKGNAADVGSAMLAAFGKDTAIAIGAVTGTVTSLAADFTLLYDLISGGGGPEANGAAWTKWSDHLTAIRVQYEQLKVSIAAIGEPTAVSNEMMAAALGMPVSGGDGPGESPAVKPTTAPKSTPASNRPDDLHAKTLRQIMDESAAYQHEKAMIESTTIADIDANNRRLEAAAAFKAQEEADHEQALARIAEQQAAEAAAFEAKKQQNAQIVAAAMNVASSLFDVYAQSLQAEVDATKSGTEAHRAALRKQWEAQHAAAEASALVNIAMATSQSLASAPYPANIALAALSAIAAGAAFAKVASAKPPSFHVGSMGNRSSNRQSDEYAATLKRNEVVVPAPTVAANGGPGGVERALSGGASTYIVVSIDGKDIDAAVDRRLTARGIPPRGHKFRAVQ